MKRGNWTGRLLFLVGIVIIVVGCILAFFNARVPSYGGVGIETEIFEWRFFLASAIQSVISGITIIGLAEIIKLLHSLNTKKMTETTVSSGKPSIIEEDASVEESREDWSLTDRNEEMIYELYSDKAILEIVPSSKLGFVIVTLQEYSGPLNSYKKVVDITSSAAKEVHDPVVEEKLLST